ncbi:MAG: hypothetical protein KatS3mg111_3018 [Pirellulaceae bacterium]|nr:MAG: hypothetical protein KatS3mg111_3018 [Pirellulaceae bacterium]
MMISLARWTHRFVLPGNAWPFDLTVTLTTIVLLIAGASIGPNSGNRSPLLVSTIFGAQNETQDGETAGPQLAAQQSAAEPDTAPQDAASGGRSSRPAEAPRPEVHLLLVVGAPGAQEFEQDFTQAAQAWERLASKNRWHVHRIFSPRHQKAAASAFWPFLRSPQEAQTVTDPPSAKEQLQQTIAHLADENRANELWLVFIGHGTYAQGAAKFNLIGPDVEAKELATWLDPIDRVIMINTSSSSAPFLVELSRPGRIIVTATRSGGEFNYARFGTFLAAAIEDTKNDLDHDGAVSLLEAFLAGSRRTEQFYAQAARLATEHALLDDNGDRVGTSADFYRGVQIVRHAQADRPIDGSAAARVILFNGPQAIVLSSALAAQRQQLEIELDRLRGKRPDLSEEAYLDALEKIMLQMAALYEQAENEQAVTAQ